MRGQLCNVYINDAHSSSYTHSLVLGHSSLSSCRESTRDLRMLGHLVFTKDPEGVGIIYERISSFRVNFVNYLLIFMEINHEAFLLKVNVVLVALLHEATGVAKLSMDQNRVWENLHHQVGVSSIIVCYHVLGG